MQNIYADIETDISELLHGVARLHVALGRMSDVGITTRGWSYNELVDGIIGVNHDKDPAVKIYKCIDCLFDTLDAIVEIGPSGVQHLHDLMRIK